MGAISLLPTSNGVFGTGLAFPRIGTWTIDFICTLLSWMIVVTTPIAPPTHCPLERIYGPKSLSKSENFLKENVSGEYGMFIIVPLKADYNLCDKAVSLLGKLFFSYAGSILMLGGSKKLITFDELPILPARLRAVVNLSQIRYARRYIKLPFESLRQPGSGYELAYQLLRVNLSLVCTIQLLSVMTAAMYYAPIAFIQFFLKYIETDPQRKDTSWGWFHVTGIFIAHFVVVLCEIDLLLCIRWFSRNPVANAQLLSLSNSNLKTNLNLQLNTLLYTKTLVRKDVPSNTNASSSDESGPSTDFSSKAEVMTLMTTDVGRARALSLLIFSLTGALPCLCVQLLPSLTQMFDPNRCCNRNYHRDVYAVQPTWYDNISGSFSALSY